MFHAHYLKMFHAHYSKMFHSHYSKMFHAHYSKILHDHYSKMFYAHYSKILHAHYFNMFQKFFKQEFMTLFWSKNSCNLIQKVWENSVKYRLLTYNTKVRRGLNKLYLIELSQNVCNWLNIIATIKNSSCITTNELKNVKLSKEYINCKVN